jgi:hypothetical protein
MSKTMNDLSNKSKEELLEIIEDLQKQNAHKAKLITFWSNAITDSRKWLENSATTLQSWKSVADVVIRKYEGDPDNNFVLRNAYHQQRGISWVALETTRMLGKLRGLLYPINPPQEEIETNEEI